MALLVAAAVHLWAQAGMMLTVPGWTAGTFRNYYVPDQLAYLAIATDWSTGTTGSVEPFTETGSIYYPRLYYQFLGTVARLTGTTAATAWTVVGLTVQVLLVAMIGLTAVLLTRRWQVALAARAARVILLLALAGGAGAAARFALDGAVRERWPSAAPPGGSSPSTCAGSLLLGLARRRSSSRAARRLR